MARKNTMGKDGEALHQDPYNNFDNPSGEEPETDMIYENYQHRDAWHLSQDGADLAHTPNSLSGEGIMGHEAPGEPDARSMGSDMHKKPTQ